MEPKEAISFAKQSFNDLFAEEPIAHLGLEEIEFDDTRDLWRVTLGFVRRPADNTLGSILIPSTRIYKTLTISDREKRLVSIKNREPGQI